MADGSEAVLAWADLLDLLAAGASVFSQRRSVYELQRAVQLNARCEYESCRGEVVKYFATRTTSEGALRSSLLVGFEMTIETNLLSKTLITARTFE